MPPIIFIDTHMEAVMWEPPFWELLDCDCVWELLERDGVRPMNDLNRSS